MVTVMLKPLSISATNSHLQNDKLCVLLEAVVNRDKTAFESLYDATVQHVYGLALRITRQPDIAEDVVSDVYLQVWQQADRYVLTRGNVLAWITIICRSRALDTLRRLKPAQIHEQSHDAIEGSFQINEAENTTDMSQDLLFAIENNAAVQHALQQLDNEQRQLLALAYFRGYSHHQLAQITGLALGTVKTRLRRTLTTLKEMMSESNQNPGVPS
ncbi:MAG TPA: sigma-70 family RNA polymerase sigma factor [Crenotrichaceae bacterium]|nr:sigma-70 family RNA polymerase sigma factor [Crenotrichaceae bacterium]